MVSMGLWLQNTSLVEATPHLALLYGVTQNPRLTPNGQLFPRQITMSGEKEYGVLQGNRKRTGEIEGAGGLSKEKEKHHSGPEVAPKPQLMFTTQLNMHLGSPSTGRSWSLQVAR